MFEIGCELRGLASLDSTYCRSGWGNFHYLVSKFSKVLQADSIGSGSQDHLHIAGKALEE
jgi:hypothetical protein